MALIVETGTGIADANSYIDIAFADTYQADRGRSAWALLTEPVKTVALIAATQFVDESLPWIGSKGTAAQGLKWPRIAGVDSLGDSILLIDRDGFDITGVPAALKKAIAEAAFLSSTDAEFFTEADSNGKIIRKKTDVLETEYQAESSALKPAQPTVYSVLNLLLKGLYVAPSTGFACAKVTRV